MLQMSVYGRYSVLASFISKVLHNEGALEAPWRCSGQYSQPIEDCQITYGAYSSKSFPDSEDTIIIVSVDAGQSLSQRCYRHPRYTTPLNPCIIKSCEARCKNGKSPPFRRPAIEPEDVQTKTRRTRTSIASAGMHTVRQTVAPFSWQASSHRRREGPSA
ncbi:hypothetical protein BDV96DRAFT_145992 [Lophiotrema nucula]|uniref:Uncharacterized protein n=1 Tax=Lophiotrema nucula TaxID=690887 RepID=A0A6A5Z1L9_9PLEO|nr:hypothetical protein BDV96DRAFT_145992 [Lophiotrema nucula]